MNRVIWWFGKLIHNTKHKHTNTNVSKIKTKSFLNFYKIRMPSLPPFANLLLLYCPPVYIAFSTFNAFKSHFSDYNFQIPPKVQFLCLLIILTPPSISICLLVSYISPDKFCISEFTSSLLESCGIYTFFSMLLVFYGGKQYIVCSSHYTVLQYTLLSLRSMLSNHTSAIIISKSPQKYNFSAC